MLQVVRPAVVRGSPPAPDCNLRHEQNSGVKLQTMSVTTKPSLDELQTAAKTEQEKKCHLKRWLTENAPLRTPPPPLHQTSSTLNTQWKKVFLSNDDLGCSPPSPRQTHYMLMSKLILHV